VATYIYFSSAIVLTAISTEAKVCSTGFIGRIFFDYPTDVFISNYKTNLLEWERITIEFQIFKLLQVCVYKYKYKYNYNYIHIYIQTEGIYS
jgi:hypothetical protein